LAWSVDVQLWGHPVREQQRTLVIEETGFSLKHVLAYALAVRCANSAAGLDPPSQVTVMTRTLPTGPCSWAGGGSAIVLFNEATP
jgi:hypothetical protein